MSTGYLKVLVSLGRKVYLVLEGVGSRKWKFTKVSLDLLPFVAHFDQDRRFRPRWEVLPKI